MRLPRLLRWQWYVGLFYPTKVILTKKLSVLYLMKTTKNFCLHGCIFLSQQKESRKDVLYIPRISSGNQRIKSTKYLEKRWISCSNQKTKNTIFVQFTRNKKYQKTCCKNKNIGCKQHGKKFTYTPHTEKSISSASAAYINISNKFSLF